MSSSCATAIALGTYCGGWRIMKTLGTKVVEVRPPQGFGSEAVAATVILASSHVGYPLSTTQVVSGAVTGSGVGRPGRAGQLARRAQHRRRVGADAARRRGHRGVCYAVIELLGGGVFGVYGRRRVARGRLSAAVAREPQAARRTRGVGLRAPDLRPGHASRQPAAT